MNRTLAETLAGLGWRYETSTGTHKNRVFNADGALVGLLAAHECWAILRERGLL